MKQYFLFLAALLFFFPSCEEISPEIPCLSCDTTNTVIEPADRKVLVEEFTGVRCVNCPQGSAEIENLISIHGDRLIAISIHSGFFSNPYDDNLYDFRTNGGDQLSSFLGEPLGYPSAIINRKVFEGESGLQLGQASWGGYVAQELSSEAPVTVNIENTYDGASRNLNVTVNGGAIQDINEEVRITVLLTETNIADMQLLPAGLESSYKHKHVLRTFLSNFNGDNLVASMTSGATYSKTYSFTIPETDETGPWDINNISIIAYLHKGGSEIEILQADEVHLAE